MGFKSSFAYVCVHIYAGSCEGGAYVLMCIHVQARGHG